MNIIKMKCDRKKLVADIDRLIFEIFESEDSDGSWLPNLKNFNSQLRTREGDVFVLLFHK